MMAATLSNPTAPATEAQRELIAKLAGQQRYDWRNRSRNAGERLALETDGTPRQTITARQKDEADAMLAFWRAFAGPDALTMKQASALIDALRGQAHHATKDLHGVEVLVDNLLNTPSAAARYGVAEVIAEHGAAIRRALRLDA